MLRDVIGESGLAFYPQVALVLFLLDVAVRLRFPERRGDGRGDGNDAGDGGRRRTPEPGVDHDAPAHARAATRQRRAVLLINLGMPEPTRLPRGLRWLSRVAGPGREGDSALPAIAFSKMDGLEVTPVTPASTSACSSP